MDAGELPYLNRSKCYFAEEIYGRTDWMQKSIDQMTDKVYITIDLDAFDPSIMPAVGTPEPGGLGWTDVLDLLRELDLEKNTIVFFCGDNGGNDYFKDAEHPRGFHGANVNPKTGVEFRGKKGNLYEGGLRIPMIARWPGKIAPGRVSLG